MPESVAVIESAYKSHKVTGSQGHKTVILLQDAHTNTSAQKNEAEFLDRLLKHHPDISTVFTEAASEDVSLSELRSSASLADRKRISEKYLRKGLLHGVEYLDMTSDHTFKIWGVEDAGLYKKSVATYAGIAKKRDKFKSYFSEIENTISELSPIMLNPLLARLEEKRKKFLKDEMSLTDYFNSLWQESQRYELPLSDYKNLLSLKTIQSMERSIHFDQANQELKAAVASLNEADQKELSLSGRKESLSKISAAKDEVSAGFLALLKVKLGARISEFGELGKYFNYLERARSLDAREILREMGHFELEILEKLYTSDDERLFVKACRTLEAHQKIFSLTLAPEDFEQYQKNKADFGIENLTGFLNEKLMQVSGQPERVVFLKSGYKDIIENCEHFYELTTKRDQAFVDNMLQKMEQESQDKAVLITGGYHTPHIRRLLESKNISYIAVSPQILNETNLMRYEKILLSQNFKSVPGAMPKLNMTLYAKSPGGPLEFQGFFNELNSGARLAHGIWKPALSKTVKRVIYPVEWMIASFAPISVMVLMAQAGGVGSDKFFTRMDHLTGYGLTLLFFVHASAVIFEKLAKKNEDQKIGRFLGPMEAVIGIAGALFAPAFFTELIWSHYLHWLDHLGHLTMAKEDYQSRHWTYKFWSALFSFVGVFSGVVLSLNHGGPSALIHFSAMIWGLSSIFSILNARFDAEDEEDSIAFSREISEDQIGELTPEETDRVTPLYRTFDEAMRWYGEQTRLGKNISLLIAPRSLRSAFNYYGLVHGPNRYAPLTIGGVRQGQYQAAHIRETILEHASPIPSQGFFDLVIAGDSERAYVPARYFDQPLINEVLNAIPLYSVTGISKEFVRRVLPGIYEVFAADPTRFEIPGVFDGRLHDEKVNYFVRQIERRLMEAENSSKRILAGTHGQSLNWLLMKLLRLPMDKFRPVQELLGTAPTASLTALAFDHDTHQWKLLVYGDNSYLPEHLKDKSATVQYKRLKIKRNFVRHRGLAFIRVVEKFLVNRAMVQFLFKTWAGEYRPADYYPTQEDFWNMVFNPSDEQLTEQLKRPIVHPKSDGARLANSSYDVQLTFLKDGKWMASSKKGVFRYRVLKLDDQSPSSYAEAAMTLAQEIDTEPSFQENVRAWFSKEKLKQGFPLVVALLDEEKDIVVGTYVYDRHKDYLELVSVDEAYRGTGAVDTLFQDMRQRPAIASEFSATIFRKSNRAQRSKPFQNFHGTTAQLKSALGVISHVEFVSASGARLADQTIKKIIQNSHTRLGEERFYDAAGNTLVRFLGDEVERAFNAFPLGINSGHGLIKDRLKRLINDWLDETEWEGVLKPAGRMLEFEQRVRGVLNILDVPRGGDYVHLSELSRRLAMRMDSLRFKLLILAMDKEWDKNVQLTLADLDGDASRLDSLLSLFAEEIRAQQPESRKVGVVFPSPRSIRPKYTKIIQRLYSKHKAVRDLYDRASQISGFSAEQLFLKNKPDRKNRVVYNLVNLLYSLSLYELFKEQAGEDFRPIVMSGDSSGILAALVAAESIALEDMIRFIVIWSNSVVEAASRLDYAVFAVHGVSAEDLAPFLEKGKVELLHDVSPVYVTLAVRNTNFEDLKNKISGEIKAAGGQVDYYYPPILPNPHSSFFKEIADIQGLTRYVNDLRVTAPKIPIASASRKGASFIQNASQVKDELLEGFFRPVYWKDAVSLMSKTDVDVFLQPGADGRLNDFGAAMNPGSIFVGFFDEHSLSEAHNLVLKDESGARLSVLTEELERIHLEMQKIIEKIGKKVDLARDEMIRIQIIQDRILGVFQSDTTRRLPRYLKEAIIEMYREIKRIRNYDRKNLGPLAREILNSEVKELEFLVKETKTREVAAYIYPEDLIPLQGVSQILGVGLNTLRGVAHGDRIRIDRTVNGVWRGVNAKSFFIKKERVVRWARILDLLEKDVQLSNSVLLKILKVTDKNISDEKLLENALSVLGPSAELRDQLWDLEQASKESGIPLRTLRDAFRQKRMQGDAVAADVRKKKESNHYFVLKERVLKWKRIWDQLNDQPVLRSRYAVRILNRIDEEGTDEAILADIRAKYMPSGRLLTVDQASKASGIFRGTIQQAAHRPNGLKSDHTLKSKRKNETFYVYHFLEERVAKWARLLEPVMQKLQIPAQHKTKVLKLIDETEKDEDIWIQAEEFSLLARARKSVEARVRAGQAVTEADVASDLGVSKGYLSKSKKNIPDLKTLLDNAKEGRVLPLTVDTAPGARLAQKKSDRYKSNIFGRLDASTDYLVTVNSQGLFFLLGRRFMMGKKYAGHTLIIRAWPAPHLGRGFDIVDFASQLPVAYFDRSAERVVHAVSNLYALVSTEERIVEVRKAGVVHFPDWFPGTASDSTYRRIDLFSTGVAAVGSVTAYERKIGQKAGTIQSYLSDHPKLRKIVYGEIFPSWFPGQPGQDSQDRINLFLKAASHTTSVSALARVLKMADSTLNSYLQSRPNLYRRTKNAFAPKWLPGEYPDSREKRNLALLDEIAKSGGVEAFLNERHLPKKAVYGYIKRNPFLREILTIFRKRFHKGAYSRFVPILLQTRYAVQQALNSSRSTVTKILNFESVKPDDLIWWSQLQQALVDSTQEADFMDRLTPAQPRIQALAQNTLIFDREIYSPKLNRNRGVNGHSDKHARPFYVLQTELALLKQSLDDVDLHDTGANQVSGARLADTANAIGQFVSMDIQAALPVLLKALDHESPQIRIGAIEALGTIAGARLSNSRPSEILWVQDKGFRVVEKNNVRLIEHGENYVPLASDFDLIMIPHSQTPANREHLFASHEDGDPRVLPTPEGLEEARKGAIAFWEKYGVAIRQHPDRFVFLRSPLSRTERTFNVYQKTIRELYDYELKIAIDPRLIEIDHGTWHLKKADQVPPSDVQGADAYRDGDFFVVTGGAESRVSLLIRVYDWLVGSQGQYTGKTLVVFGHGQFQNAVETLLQTYPGRAPVDVYSRTNSSHLRRGYAHEIYKAGARLAEESEFGGRKSDVGKSNLSSVLRPLTSKNSSESFLFHSYNAKRRTGRVMIGSTLFHVRVKNEKVYVYSRNLFKWSEPFAVEARALKVNPVTHKASLTFSQSDILQFAAENVLKVDTLTGAHEKLLQQPAVVRINSDRMMDAQSWDAAISLLTHHLKRMHKKYPKAVFVLRGVKAEAILKQVLSEDAKATEFVFLNPALPTEYATAASATLSFIGAQDNLPTLSARNVFVKAEEGAVHHFQNLMELTLFEALMGEMTTSNPLFLDFIRTFSDLIGEPIKNLDELIQVLSGNEKNLNVILRYAFRPKPVPVNAQLRAYILLDRQSAQAA